MSNSKNVLSRRNVLASVGVAIASGVALTESAASASAAAGGSGTLQSANNLSDVASANTTLVNIGAAANLTAAPIKKASCAAAANQLVPCDATSGAFTVTLPAAPPDKSRITVKKIDSSTNAVTVATSGSDVFTKVGGSNSVDLSLQDQAVALQYTASAGLWQVVGNHLPLGELDRRYTLATSSCRKDTRILQDTASTYSSSFTYSAISSNQDGHLVWKNLTVHSGFGGQVGQGGPISYFKGVGGNIIHDGPGNFDGYWMSVEHNGPREAGVFVTDITGNNGGNVYGGHVRVVSNTTAPQFHVGWLIENVPNVAAGTKVVNTLGVGIAAATPTTSIVLGTAAQLTEGTNINMTDALGNSVVAYVSASMTSPSITLPVVSFTSSTSISAASIVQVGVGTAYYGACIQNNGSHGASAAIQIESHGTATEPYHVGINFDSSVASSTATGIFLGGSWGQGINFNGNTAVAVGSVAGVGSSPNRDVRVADNLLLDNARYIKFKDSSGKVQKAISGTSSDHLRFKRIAPGSQFEFYDDTETTLLARITSSGRGDFSTAGVTSKYNTLAPTFLTNGHIEIYFDGQTTWLVAHANGATHKVALT
jgi:hypothetical protein